MKFSDIQASVNELCHGRTFTAAKQARWINNIRTSVAVDFHIYGFHGLYFLYKEATVENGSVADQARYAVPSDHITDLNVFFDGALLMKSPPGILDITQGIGNDSSTPMWMKMRGVEFELEPPPSEGGKEIKLFYCGLPDTVTAEDGDLEDHFMKLFPDLHIFGMSERGMLSIGDDKKAMQYGSRYMAEQQKLQLHNRQWFIKNARLRVQNWEEFQEQKIHIFPQFGNI